MFNFIRKCKGRKKKMIKNLSESELKYIVKILKKHCDKLEDVAWPDETKKVKHLKSCQKIMDTITEEIKNPVVEPEQIFDKIAFYKGSEFIAEMKAPKL